MSLEISTEVSIVGKIDEDGDVEISVIYQEGSDDQLWVSRVNAIKLINKLVKLFKLSPSNITF